jgi:tetratricopeptide (TPR) repeat protein
MYRGEAAVTLRELTAVLALYRERGRRRNVVITLRGIALALTALNRFGDALAPAQEARDLAQDPLDLVMGSNCCGWVQYRGGELTAAEAWYRDAVDLSDRAGTHYERARALTGLGNIAALRGDQPEASRRWADADGVGVILDPAMLGEALARRTLEASFPADDQAD